MHASSDFRVILICGCQDRLNLVRVPSSMKHGVFIQNITEAENHL